MHHEVLLIPAITLEKWLVNRLSKYSAFMSSSSLFIFFILFFGVLFVWGGVGVGWIIHRFQYNG